MYKKKIYSYGFLVPAGIIFTIFFLIPIIISFYYSMTVWNFDSATFCGLDNYKMLFQEEGLRKSLSNTLIYAVLTSGIKVVAAFGKESVFLLLFLLQGLNQLTVHIMRRQRLTARHFGKGFVISRYR